MKISEEQKDAELQRIEATLGGVLERKHKDITRTELLLIGEWDYFECPVCDADDRAFLTIGKPVIVYIDPTASYEELSHTTIFRLEQAGETLVTVDEVIKDSQTESIAAFFGSGVNVTNPVRQKLKTF